MLAVRNYESGGSKLPFSPLAEKSPLPEQNYSLIEESFLYGYRDLTLEELSSHLGLSPRQTERLLRSQYGKTFRQKKKRSKNVRRLSSFGGKETQYNGYFPLSGIFLGGAFFRSFPPVFRYVSP